MANTFVLQQSMMKGLKILRDEKTGKRYVQIEVDPMVRQRGAASEHLDAILLEHRKKAFSVPLADRDGVPK